MMSGLATDTVAHAAQWQVLRPLLERVLACPPSLRMQVVEEMTSTQPALRAELVALLNVLPDDSARLLTGPDQVAWSAAQAWAHLSAGHWLGCQLGPYLIEDLLGQGGMGEVYRARRTDGQFEQQVAIKCMRTGFDQDFLRPRFENERQILSTLDHPNLARILDGGMGPQGLPYIVMELIDGEALDAYCARHALPLVQRLHLFITVCDVVHYIHTQGVIHRDIKFSNILVTRDGVVKLLDFGIAKRHHPGSDGASATLGTRQLTLSYASPEQVAGRWITPASDVYSLGVVLYRLLTGVSPYHPVDETNSYELCRAICEAVPVPPSRVASAHHKVLRGDVDAIVAMALRKEVAQRYDMAAWLADDLRRHLACRPVQARRGAWSYRLGRLLLRHRRAFALGTAANVVLSLALVVAVRATFEARAQRARAQEQLAQVHHLANVLAVDVSQAIENLPGAQKARHVVIDNGLKHLQQLQAADYDAPRLAFDIATAHNRLGELQWRFANGDAQPDEADLHFQAAQRLLQDMDEREAVDMAQYLQSRALLAKVLGYRAYKAMWEDADRERAASFYAHKLAVATDLATRSGDVAHHHLLANTYNELAWLHDEIPEEFRRYSEQAISRLRELNARAPADKGVQTILANVLLARGGHEVDYAEPDRAEPFLQESRRIYWRLRDMYPDDAEYLLHIAELQAVRSRQQLALGSIQEAHDLARRAIQSMASLRKADASNVTYQLEWADKHVVLSQVLHQQGQLVGALEATEAALLAVQGVSEEHRRRSFARHVEFKVRRAMALSWSQMSVGADARGAAHAQAQACQQWAQARQLAPDYARQVRGRRSADWIPAELDRAWRDCGLAPLDK